MAANKDTEMVRIKKKVVNKARKVKKKVDLPIGKLFEDAFNKVYCSPKIKPVE